MIEGPTGPQSATETCSNEHNYGVLNAVCANMHQIIMRLIPFSHDLFKPLHQHLTARVFCTCPCVLLYLYLHIYVYVCGPIHMFYLIQIQEVMIHLESLTVGSNGQACSQTAATTTKGFIKEKRCSWRPPTCRGPGRRPRHGCCWLAESGAGCDHLGLPGSACDPEALTASLYPVRPQTRMHLA